MTKVGRLTGFGVIALLLCSAPAHSEQPADSADQPRLAVFIVVDQFGSNLLDFHKRSLTGGFRRLLERGRYYPNAVVDHAPTNSLPGHLSAATGAYPRRHGIVDNGWVEIADGRPVVISGFNDTRCRKITPDGAVQSDEGHAIGPGRFESPTLVEWVMAARPGARFASVGTGGGVSALHAGRARGPVLWYDSSDGVYVSSTCYLERLPAWALAFNGRLAESHMDEDWGLQASPSMLEQLRPDAADFEHDGEDIRFPHRRPGAEEIREWFNFSPFVDEATLDLARAAVAGENLGTDGITDVLTIGLSSLDHVGHRFGPFSVEQADALHRLDRHLAAFFDFLDEQVGAGRWVLALTADHGAPPAPEGSARFGIEGARRISEGQVLAAIDEVRSAAGAKGDRNAAANAAEELPFVGRVLRIEQLASPSDAFERLYANSYRPGRVSRHPLYENAAGEGVAEFGIIPIPHPHWVVDWATSIHGSPYAYDRRVPVFFYGPGIAGERDAAAVRTIDVAPTLAATVGVEPTDQIDGRALDLRRAGIGSNYR